MKLIKYSFILIISAIVFYLSDKTILYVESKSPLMSDIVSKMEDYNTEPVNAIINGNTIIPGLKGKKVNKRESYLKMNDFGAFNENFFVYDTKNPEISLKDNLDKMIIKGNKKDSVSLIVDNEKFMSVLDNNNINYATYINSEIKLKNNVLYINNSYDINEFNKINKYLKKNNKNSKICLDNISNIEFCKSNKYYLVSPSLNINRSNLVSSLSNIKGGDILLINSNLNINECNIILNRIKSNNLKIISLEDMISE